MLESLANKVRQGLANRERDVQKEELDAIREVQDDDADFEKDEAHLDGVRDGSSGADRAGGYGMFQRFYDRGYDLGAKKSQEDALVFRDPPDIKRMKQGLKRISRPRSAGDFRSDKERFKKP